MKKINAVLVLLLVFALALSGCSFGPKEDLAVSVEDLEITLDTGFKHIEQEGFTSCYSSSQISVFFLREDFDLFKTDNEENSDMSLKEYLELVIKANNKDTSPVEENGLTYFSFINQNKGTDYFYKVFAYKGSRAFWLVQFAVKESQIDKYEEQIDTFAKSVIVK